jgi:hypothetical protein
LVEQLIAGTKDDPLKKVVVEEEEEEEGGKQAAVPLMKVSSPE